MLPSKIKPIPVILDTDIGTDIDDTWALAMLLRCPELDLKLVTTCTGDTTYRAKLTARFLDLSGRSDVAIGIGPSTPLKPDHITQGPWVLDYALKDFPGRLYDDGVQAMVDIIMKSREPVTIISIGPLTNVGAALEREPRIAERAAFVGMHGSIDWSHAKDHKPIAEYNVVKDIPACQRVFAASWKKRITPLDTCGQVRLTGDKYRAVAESKDTMAKMVMDNFRIWQNNGGWNHETDQSSVLFDCVAVHLAYSRDYLGMETLGLCVTDDGFTVRDERSSKVECAMSWRDLGAFEDLIVRRLTSDD